MRERIKRLISLGVSQTAICNSTGISNTMISRWLKGDRELREENEKRVAAWLEEFKKQVAEI